MDDDVVYIHSRILHRNQKNEIIARAATDRDYYTKCSRSDKDRYHMISKKSDTNELTYKTKIDSQI